MTREEATEQFKYSIELIKQDGKDYLDERDIPMLKMAIESLEDQKIGHWIEKNVNQDGTHNIYCSNCNNYLKFKGHANSYDARTKLKYCQNCGAKMKGFK